MANPLFLLAYAASKKIATDRAIENKRAEQAAETLKNTPRYSGYTKDGNFMAGVYANSPEYANLNSVTHFQIGDNAPTKVEKPFTPTKVYWDKKNNQQISADQYINMTAQPGDVMAQSPLGFTSVRQPPRAFDDFAAIGTTKPDGTISYVPEDMRKRIMGESAAELNTFFLGNQNMGQGPDGYAAAVQARTGTKANLPIMQMNPEGVLSQAVAAPENVEEKDLPKVVKYRFTNPDTNEISYYNTRPLARKAAKEVGLEDKDVEEVTGTFPAMEEGETITPTSITEVKFYEPKEEKAVEKKPTKYEVVQLPTGEIKKVDDLSPKQKKEWVAGKYKVAQQTAYDDGTIQTEIFAYKSDSTKSNSKQANAMNAANGLGVEIKSESDPESTVFFGYSTKSEVSNDEKIGQGLMSIRANPEEYKKLLSDETKLADFRTYMANAVRLAYTDYTTDPQTGMRRQDLPVMNNVTKDFAFRNYPELKNIPGMEQQLRRIFDEEIKAYRSTVEQDATEGTGVGLVAEGNIPVADPDDPENVIDTSVIMGINVPTKYGQTVDILRSTYALSDDTIASFIRKQEKPDGTFATKVGGNGNKITLAAEEQPELDMISDLMSQPFYFNDSAGRQIQGSMLDILINEVTPESYRQFNMKYDSITRERVSTAFIEAVGDRPEQGIKLIQNLNRASGNSFGKKAMAKRYGSGNLQKVIDGARAEADSANTAWKTLNNMEATFYFPGPDGKPDYSRPIGLSTAIGEYVLGADGILYVVEKGVEFLQSGLEGLAGGQRVNPEDVGAVARQSFARVQNIVMSPEQAETAGRGSAEENLAAKKRNQERFDALLSDMNSGDTVTVTQNGQTFQVAKRLLAVRRFYKFLAAYQMAAAIQGGTGGRTISDQDVENMLNSFNFTTTSRPESELATIRAAKGMMNRIRRVKGAIGSDSNAERYAGMVYERLELNAEGEQAVSVYDDIFSASGFLMEEGATPAATSKPKDEGVPDIKSFNSYIAIYKGTTLDSDATSEEIKNHPLYSEYMTQMGSGK